MDAAAELQYMTLNGNSRLRPACDCRNNSNDNH